MSYIGQKEDRWEAGQRKKRKKAYNKAHPLCPLCGKRPKNLDAHLKDVHRVKQVPTPKSTLVSIEGDK